MSDKQSTEFEELWEHWYQEIYSENKVDYEHLNQISSELNKDWNTDFVNAFLKQKIRSPFHPQINSDKYIGMELISQLGEATQKALFSELLYIGSSPNGYRERAFAIVKSMPRDWVLSHLEECVEPFLAFEDWGEYVSFLGLYREISPALEERLIKRIREHPSAEIREILEE